jgi:DNA polymerase-3 subunit delta'
LLPTIVSRCQEIKLRPLSAETVEQALLARGALAPETAALLARISGGRLGWAITASTSPRVLESRQAAFDSLVTLVQAGRAERLSLADKLAAKSAELPQLFEYWLGWWRDVLLAQSGGAGRMVNVDYTGALEAHARGAPVEAVERALTATRASLRYLGQNANARLVTEVLVLDFPLIEVK